MKEIIAFILGAVFLAIPVAQAQYNYTTNDGGITISRYSGPGGAVSIPATVNGLPVTRIGNSAFWDSAVSSVAIPGSVTNIDDYAFYSCPSLASVRIAGGVTTIGHSAFLFCSSLTNITISDNLTSIADSAFWDCGLTGVTIPAGVTNIGYDAFDSCTNLTSVSFKGNAPTVGSSVFAYDTNATVYYLPGMTGWSSQFAGLPAVLWNPLIQIGDPGFGVRSNRFEFKIMGTPNIVAVVETTTNSSGGDWVPLQTITLTNGKYNFSESVQTNNSGFYYRLAMP